jgi:hypothetical protein
MNLELKEHFGAINRNLYIKRVGLIGSMPLKVEGIKQFGFVLV